MSLSDKTFSTLAGFCCHSIFMTGLSLGFITFIPNGMMRDSGTTLEVRFSNIGVSVSFLFIVSGFEGTISKKWSALLPGAIRSAIFYRFNNLI
jgi:hypothetical protein